MSKKSKIKIMIWTVILLMVGGFLFVFNFNPLVPVSFLATLPANQEQKEMYENRKSAKVKKPKEEFKTSCQNSKTARVQNANNQVEIIDVTKTEGYKKMQGYINKLERSANALKAIQKTYDVFGYANPDAVVDILPFLTLEWYDDMLLLPKEADFAMIDAMCDPSIEWETKYWLSQYLGHRQAKEALPLFREIAQDEEEPFLLKISSMDQIGNMQDSESKDMLVGLLDNKDDIIRDKASAILRDVTEQGDEYIYNEIASRYYAEIDKIVKTTHLGSMILIGGENALPEVREILKTGTPDEKDTVAILLEEVRSDASVDLLMDMYDPGDENLSTSVISSLAKLGTEEANEFLYEMIDEVNGGNSVMAASYLIDQRDKAVIAHIEEALQKEKNEEFIRCYQDMLKRSGR